MQTYLKKNQRKAQLCTRLLLVAAAFVLALALFLLCGARLHAHQAQASSAAVTETRYTAVYVQPGDTLWELADAYMDESYADKNAFIAEVKQINNITEASLQAGSYIIVPYTVTVLQD